MQSHDLLGAAAAAGHQDLLAQAADRRLRREASAGRHLDGATTVGLADGSQVLLRAIGPGDTELLVDAFARLSARSRRLRFLGPKKALTPAELRYFTDVDHEHHEAIAALDLTDGRAVGVARYVRSDDDHGAAECAVAVVDAWHRRGLGSQLLTRLAERARQAGIHRFTGAVARDNVAMVHLLRTLRTEVLRVPGDAGTMRFAVTLAGSAGDGHPPRTLAS